MAVAYLSLASADHPTEPIPVGARNTSAAIGIFADEDTYATWTGGVVEVKWTIELGDNEKWWSFYPAVTLTPTAPAIRNVGVHGATYLRLETTTIDHDADPGAKVVYSLR